jgi:hypothetical protein
MDEESCPLILSISLGSSKRDKESCLTVGGRTFLVRRVGVDGDLRRFAQMFREWDGRASALGIGGADLYLWIDHKKYAFRQVKRLVSQATKTPVVDGSGLKHTLERRLVRELQERGIVDFRQERVFLTMAVDRFGMAQALDEVCPQVIYGDLMFGLGLPIPIRRYRTLRIMGRILLPLLTWLPFTWFYPTGAKQEVRKPRFQRFFNWASVIAGDWHYIHRHCPEDLPGKIILTNTLRKDDLAFLKKAGVRRVITSTPEVDGETFGTNVLEGVLVAFLGKRAEELSPEDYEKALEQMGWEPKIFEL